MRHYYLLVILMKVTCIVANVKENPNSPQSKSDQIPIIKIDDAKQLSEVVKNSIKSIINATTTTSTTVRTIIDKTKSDDILQSGALLRFFFVLLGITIILLFYLGFRMIRLRKTKPPALVRKYGVLTNRADVEMLPLPLSEDEEDDTVFEINNQRNT